MTVQAKDSDGEAPRKSGVDSVRSSATRRSNPEVALADTVDSGGELGWLRRSIAPGTLLEGAYRIEEEIGRGGMGAVYRAEHVTLGRSFAIKVVGAEDQMNQELVSRLIKEAQTASSIEHENIVDVTHLGTDPDTGLVFVVMELLRGEDLRKRLERQLADGDDPWLPDAEVRRLAGQFLSALAAAHGAGVVHRDLKPENVFIAKKAGGQRVKVVDFGMSKLSINDSSVRLTKTGQLIGTPLYMAPEQSADGAEADERADVYSLGVMLYEMLCGEVPFPVDTVYACILSHATKPPPPLGPRRPDLPAPVVEVIHRCLEKDPDDRFEDVGALREAWDAAWEGRSAAPEAGVESDADDAPEAGAPGPSQETRRVAPVLATPDRRPWIVAALVGLAALGLAGWATLGGDEPEPRVAAPPPPAAPVVEAEPEPEPEPVPEPAPEAPPEPAPVLRSVTITSTPSGAEIFDGDESIGTTPHTLEVSEDAAPRALELRMRGRRSATVEVTADGPDELSATLRRASRGSADDLAGW